MTENNVQSHVLLLGGIDVGKPVKPFAAVAAFSICNPFAQAVLLLRVA